MENLKMFKECGDKGLPTEDGHRDGGDEDQQDPLPVSSVHSAISSEDYYRNQHGDVSSASAEDLSPPRVGLR
jgi:hypothetical protein